MNCSRSILSSSSYIRPLVRRRHRHRRPSLISAPISKSVDFHSLQNATSFTIRTLHVSRQTFNKASISLLVSSSSSSSSSSCKQSFFTTSTNPRPSQQKSEAKHSFDNNTKTKTKTNTKARTYYRVDRISPDGTCVSGSLTVADIIRGSSVHVRDLFSLALTPAEEEKQEDIQVLPKLDDGDYDDDNDNDNDKHDDENIERMAKRISAISGKKRKIIQRNPSPVILPRGEKVIVSFGHIKAVIGKNEGMLFNAHDPSIKLLAKELTVIFQERSQQNSINEFFNNKAYNDPFEVVFLEQILHQVCSTWSRRILLYQPIVDNLGEKSLTSDLYNSQSSASVQRLVPLKDSLQNFEMQVLQALDCLTTLLNDDEDMVHLLLTAQAAAAEEGKDVDLSLHEGVELMFEEYSRQLHNLSQEIHYLLRRVESKQDLLKMSLDSYRNQMLRANVYLSVGAVCLATSTTIAGYFGMNLLHGLETDENAFAAVVAGTGGLSGCVFLWCMYYVNSSRISKTAVSQFAEIKIITKALSDLNAVDYAAKCLLESEKGVDKDEFKAKLNDARNDGRKVSEKEVKFLFDILDANRDGRLQKEELRRFKGKDTSSK